MGKTEKENMLTFVRLALIYIIGGTLGWCTELIFRRIVHKRWINPGFLVGPNLPLYGIGVLTLYIICSIDYSFISVVWLRYVFVIAVITVMMTAIEYVTGLIFIKGLKVKLWDYSDRLGNVQGIICPLFTLLWGLAGAAYYILLHPFVTSAVAWIGENTLYSFFLGVYFGIMAVDVGYSFHIVAKLRSWANEQKLTVKYEELKLAIAQRASQIKQKRNFMLWFRTKDGLNAELDFYKLKSELTSALKNARKRKSASKEDDNAENE